MCVSYFMSGEGGFEVLAWRGDGFWFSRLARA
jgi:hypothetical protein